MAIRDQYKVSLLNGREIVVAATRQGGAVTLAPGDKDDDFMVFTEATKNGSKMRTVHVAKAVIESVEFKNG